MGKQNIPVDKSDSDWVVSYSYKFGKYTISFRFRKTSFRNKYNKRLLNILTSIHDQDCTDVLSGRTGMSLVGLAFRCSRVRVPVAAASLVICGQHLQCAIRVAQGVLPCVGWGGNDQSIGSTVSDAVVRCWLWSTAAGSCSTFGLLH